jgi:hypothetical protein
LKSDYLFSIQGVCSIVEDLLLGFLKEESVWCKCTIKIKGQFLKMNNLII